MVDTHLSLSTQLTELPKRVCRLRREGHWNLGCHSPTLLPKLSGTLQPSSQLYRGLDSSSIRPDMECPSLITRCKRMAWNEERAFEDRYLPALQTRIWGIHFVELLWLEGTFDSGL